MINLTFLLRIILQLIQILLGSGLLGDDDRQTLNGIMSDVKRIRQK